MKKILFTTFILIALLSACRRDNDPAPAQRPDERLNEVLSQYKTQLVNAEHGWKALLLPEGGAGYSFWIKFNENDRLSMSSDISSATTAEMTSTYRLKAMQRPSLLFDTYSYLHILSDPDATKSGGDWGQGKYSDFEFSFDSASPDTIRLTGNLKGSKLLLVKANQEEATNYINRIAATARAFENISRFTTYFKRLSIGNTAMDINVDANTRFITFTYAENDQPQTFTTSYYYTEDGLSLLEPLVTNNITITTFRAVQYDADNRRINLIVNDIAASIQEATRPAKVDMIGTRSFFNTPADDYWIALTGFTIDGVRDSLKVSSIPNFSLLVYWPKFGDANGSKYDLLGFVFGNSIHYGPAAVPSLTADGRIIYTFLGNLGTVPPEHEPIVTATRDIWTQPEGFYVVRTSSNSLDLVSAKDARAWLTLFR